MKLLFPLILLAAALSLAVELTAAVVFALRGAWWVTLCALLVAAATVFICRTE